MDEQKLERERVEWALGYTGGELSDEPFTYEERVTNYKRLSLPVDQDTATDEKWGYVDELETRSIRYWFEGIPDWCTHDTNRMADGTPRYDSNACQVPAMTWVQNCLFGKPTPPLGWEFIEEFTHSGETECPWCSPEARENGAPGVVGTRCELCENLIKSDGPNYLYIGDGWMSLVLAPVTEGREEMIEQVARTFLVDGWMTFIDYCEEDGEDISVLPSMSGREIGDVMDETMRLGLWCAPDDMDKEGARELARDFVRDVELANNESIVGMWLIAERKQELVTDHPVDAPSYWEEPEQSLFAHYLAMESLGHGVAWSDSHPEHGFEIESVDGYIFDVEEA